MLRMRSGSREERSFGSLRSGLTKRRYGTKFCFLHLVLRSFCVDVEAGMVLFINPIKSCRSKIKKRRMGRLLIECDKVVGFSRKNDIIVAFLGIRVGVR